jgi:hypothetical protein
LVVIFIFLILFIPIFIIMIIINSAYVQTGSGKSYSIMGYTDKDNQEGLIPRICKV